LSCDAEPKAKVALVMSWPRRRTGLLLTRVHYYELGNMLFRRSRRGGGGGTHIHGTVGSSDASPCVRKLPTPPNKKSIPGTKSGLCLQLTQWRSPFARCPFVFEWRPTPSVANATPKVFSVRSSRGLSRIMHPGPSSPFYQGSGPDIHKPGAWSSLELDLAVG
jgi:hypothetical protein